ncbi:MAG: metal ABC transporter solute-binding protein, Zn/Mn family [Nanobdellota archaeon]
MRWLVLVLLLIGVMLSACGEKADSENLKVVVSLSPFDTFVKWIADDRAEVIKLVPSGANPHTYEPSPGKMARVSNSDVYFKAGSGIDFEVAWSGNIEKLNEDIKVFDCSKNLSFNDPHVWVSPRKAEIILKNIYSGLVSVDPANKEFYKNNLNHHLEELSRLDKYIKAALSSSSTDKFIVYHGAWQNFANDYGLEQVAIENAGKKPSAKDMQLIIKTAKENDINVIFTSPQFSEKNAKVIAKEINGQVIKLDPLAVDYIDNLKNVADAIGKT